MGDCTPTSSTISFRAARKLWSRSPRLDPSATAVLISNAVEASLPPAKSPENAADTTATTIQAHPPSSKAPAICQSPNVRLARLRVQKLPGYQLCEKARGVRPVRQKSPRAHRPHHLHGST